MGKTQKPQILYSPDIYKLVETSILYYMYYVGIICPQFSDEDPRLRMNKCFVQCHMNGWGLDLTVIFMILMSIPNDILTHH